MTIQENIAVVRSLRKRVQGHCMCLDLDETKTHIFIKYPEGYLLGGLRIEITTKKEAFEKALDLMEKHWKESLL